MKKPTTTRSALAEQLRILANALQVAAGFDIEALAAGSAIEPSAVIEKFFGVGEALAAPDRGRGRRVRILVSWIWPPAHIDEQQGTGMVVARIRSLPGVEDVTAPILDTQLGLIWSVDVTIRISQ